MFCINCGNTLSKDSAFCGKCGQQVAIADVSNDINPEDFELLKKRQQKRKPALYVFVVSQIMIFIFLVVGEIIEHSLFGVLEWFNSDPWHFMVTFGIIIVVNVLFFHRVYHRKVCKLIPSSYVLIVSWLANLYFMVTMSMAILGRFQYNSLFGWVTAGRHPDGTPRAAIFGRSIDIALYTNVIYVIIAVISILLLVSIVLVHRKVKDK